MHLIIDGFDGDPTRLASGEVIRALLERYPDAIGMKPASEPQVLSGDAAYPAGCDVSGFVMSTESHITIHTSAARGQAWVDIFSAQEFDSTRAIIDFTAALGLREVTTRLVERDLNDVER
jgi:S-adenosylmethionine/arginine decarboxylase-like enzyme